MGNDIELLKLVYEKLEKTSDDVSDIKVSIGKIGAVVEEQGKAIENLKERILPVEKTQNWLSLSYKAALALIALGTAFSLINKFTAALAK